MIKKIFRFTAQTSSLLNQALQRKIIFQYHLIPITGSGVYPELFLQADENTAHSWGHSFQGAGLEGGEILPQLLVRDVTEASLGGTRLSVFCKVVNPLFILF